MRARSGRSSGSPRRDHRAGRRPQDGHQRLQLGRADLHGRLRGRELADVGERRRRPAEPHGRDRADDLARAGREELRAERRGRRAPRPAARLASCRSATSRSTASTSRPGSSTSASTSSATPSACSSADRGRTSTSRSSRATSRRGSGTTSSASRRIALGIPRGTIRATVLIETILAAFEMDEILYELREHSAGLNAGPLGLHLLGHQEVPRAAGVRAPGSRAGDDDRPVHARVHRAPRPDVPLGAARTRSAAWRRSSRAAAIPRSTRSRWPASARTSARESGDGFDGTWVAHPDLVPGWRWPSSTPCSATGRTSSSACARTSTTGRPTCSNVAATPGEITEAGVRANVSVGIRYIAAWLQGVGAAAIDNLMEDAATAEISRSQIWQWIHHGRVERARRRADRRRGDGRAPGRARVSRGPRGLREGQPRGGLRRLPHADGVRAALAGTRT